MVSLGSVSVYYLILELCQNGKTGLLPELEPIPLEAIREELASRTGQKFRSTNEWTTWFIGNSEYGTELERANLLIYLKEEEYFKKLLQEVQRKGRS